MEIDNEPTNTASSTAPLSIEPAGEPDHWDDLACDQIFTEPEVVLGDTIVVNELSVYDAHPDIAVTIYRGRVVLRSSKPFTLRRFRQRLQINLPRVNYLPMPGDRYELYTGVGDISLRRPDCITEQPLKAYKNRYCDEGYMQSILSSGASSPNDYTERAERAYNNFCEWGCVAEVREERPELRDDKEAMDREVERRRNLGEKWFRVGYADMMRRRERDREALEAAQDEALVTTLARTEWTLWGAALDVKFFNPHKCGQLSVENRTLSLIPSLGLQRPHGGGKMLVPYDRPCVCFGVKACDAACPHHCPPTLKLATSMHCHGKRSGGGGGYISELGHNDSAPIISFTEMQHIGGDRRRPLVIGRAISTQMPEQVPLNVQVVIDKEEGKGKAKENMEARQEADQLATSHEAAPDDTRFRTGLRMIYLGGLLGDEKILKYGNDVMDRFRK